VDLRIEVVAVPVSDVDDAKGLPLGEPGSVKGLQLSVDDLDAVREALVGRGVEVSDAQQLGPEGSPGSRYAFFQDPDGNGWAIQELKRG
jgi:catechol 2,3-dioxygenase-like lactoylglutathione lyase family enzyme